MADFSPDGRKVFTHSQFDSTVKIWDCNTGKELNILKVNYMSVGACFLPDSKNMLVISTDFIARILDVETGVGLIEFIDSNRVNGTAISPDGTKVLTYNFENGNPKIWNVINGKEMSRISYRGFLFNTPVFSPDGSKVVIAEGKTAEIFETKSGRLLTTLSGHFGNISSVNFSPDGTQILTSTGEITKLWDISSGNEIASFITTGKPDFSPDGKKIAVPSINNTLRIWNISIPDIIKDMGGKIEDLSAEEKEKYGIRTK